MTKLFLDLETEDLILKKISEKDIKFIKLMFSDLDIMRYYIVQNDIGEDYEKLVNYWLSIIASGNGFAWIIWKKGSGLFRSDKPCGFIHFEFKDSSKNVRISYALKPEFRKNGIVSRSIELLIKNLEAIGVTSIEADINKNNINSEAVVKKLGFKTDKSKALLDLKSNKNELRFLWRKELFNYSSLNFHYINENILNNLINFETVFKLFEEEVQSSPKHGIMARLNQMQETARFHLTFTTNVTENMVGISNNNSVHKITWELLREVIIDDRNFLVFCGWGDPDSTGKLGGMPQFDYYEIGIDKDLFANILGNLISRHSAYFQLNKMNNVIGLESFKFENGQIYI